MILNPIIPIWLMAIVCVGLLCLKRKGVWPFVRQIAIVLLLFLINLRPMIPGVLTDVQEQESNVYVQFVIDNTISMLARDYQGGKPRMEGVKKDCAYIVDQIPEAKFSVISFQNAANVMSPFTTNAEHIKNMIDTIYPMNELYARGSTLNVAKPAMLSTLKSLKEKRDVKTAVFFISDGEITDDSTLESFAELKQYIGDGAVLGYGSESGGQMYIKNYTEEEELVEDHSSGNYGNPAISKMDAKNLKQIANDMGVDYIDRNNGGNLDGVIQSIRNNAEVKTNKANPNRKTDKTENAQDIYFWFGIPLMMLLVYEAFIVLRNK